MLPLTSEASQLFLSVIAIQRVLLYFLPSYEKHLQLSEAGMKIIVFLFVILSNIVKSYQKPKNAIGHYTRIELAFDATLYVMVSISALSYVPIFISIRKLTYLVSVQENQPLRYIAWQMIAIFGEKIFGGLLLILATVIYPKDISITSPSQCVLFLRIVELILLPLLIELTYIGSNRRNLLTALTSLKSWRGFRSLCCPWIKTTQVEQANNLAVISSTHMELRAAAVQN